ncbi:MAG: GNAT family N-acetyltransferase, partial [Eubacteriales bacterium]|nr:GNAT family N-acetyltransferase [Eubacteriales bacterium]
PAFQGLGLGTAFFDFVLREYEGKVARIRLEIEPANRRAKKLYEKLGFQDIGYESMVLDFHAQ